MKVLLLAGYRNIVDEEPLGLNRDPNGQRILDSRIRELSQLGFEVICVLAGSGADEQLRLCPRIANTELVFDTSDQLSLASNLKTGLAAAENEGCFVLPVEVAPPPADLWRMLRQELGRMGFHTESPILQAIDAQGAPWHLGFPLLITLAGNKQICKLSNFVSLVDPRLPYYQVVFEPQPEVAQQAKAL